MAASTPPHTKTKTAVGRRRRGLPAAVRGGGCEEGEHASEGAGRAAAGGGSRVFASNIRLPALRCRARLEST